MMATADASFIQEADLHLKLSGKEAVAFKAFANFESRNIDISKEVRDVLNLIHTALSGAGV